MVKYLGETQVVELHRRMIAATGGRGGLRDRALLQSALGRPRAAFAGQDAYVSIPEKAAALMHSLVSNHPFIDGNKRVAVAAAELFLGINGYRLLADNATLEDVTLDAASGRIGVDEIRLCIEHRILRVWE